MGCHLSAIHKKKRTGHGAVYLQPNVLLKIIGINHQLFPVNGMPPPRQFTGRTGVLLSKGPFNTPVVG